MDFPNYLISETLDSGEIVVLNSTVKMTHRYRNGVYWTPFNYPHDLSALARTFKARKIDGKEIVKLGLIYKVKSNGEENKSKKWNYFFAKKKLHSSLSPALVGSLENFENSFSKFSNICKPPASFVRSIVNSFLGGLRGIKLFKMEFVGFLSDARSRFRVSSSGDPLIDDFRVATGTGPMLIVLGDGCGSGLRST